MKTLALPLACLTLSLSCNAASEEIVLGEVQVTDYSSEGSAAQGYRLDTAQVGPLGRKPLQDTPLAIQGVSAELIRNTQASNSGEALKYLPTVYTNTGASQITPYFTLRGLSASSWTYNMAVDGMRSFDIWQPLEDKAGIEVLSGAASFLYGVTSAAGMINYSSKRPTRTPLAELTLGTYAEQFYGHLDLGGPVAGRTDLRYRLNLGLADAGEVGVDGQRQERYSLSGALDWQLSRDTLVTLDLSRARRQIDQPQVLFVPNAASGIPDAPDASRNWGPKDGDTLDLTSRVSLGLESRLNDTFTLRTKLRYTDDERRYLMGRQYLQNADLDYRWRLDAHDRHQRSAWQYNLYLDADFASGPLQHKLTLGGSHDDFKQDWNGYRSLYTGAGAASWYPGNLDGSPWAPDLSPAPGTQQQQESTYATWMLADQISIGEQWEILLGGTRARVHDRQKSKTAAGLVSESRYEESEFTPAFALSFKPLPALTTYVSYMEALEQGFTSTAAGNLGESFPPFLSRQKEAGLKATLGGMQLSAAWFHIRKANQMVENNIASQDGEAIHKGWEFSLGGRLTRELTLVGGFTLLDAQVTQAANGLNEGRTPQGVPEKMFKLYAEYDLPWVPGLTLTGGLSHTGKVPVDAANTLYVPSVTLGDLGLRYRHKLYGKDATWRMNVSNVGDKDYWSSRSGMLYLGAPRTLSLSATLAF